MPGPDNERASGSGIKPKPGGSAATTDAGVTLKLKIASHAPPGIRQETFTGKDDAGRVHMATLNLVVQ